MSWQQPSAPWAPPEAKAPEPVDEPEDAAIPADELGTVEPPRIFISYRRSETSAFVETLNGRLCDDLTSINVYRDTDKQLPGEDFESRIFEEIARSDAVLVVIGPLWETIRSEPDPEPRLTRPDDLVRREVVAALADWHPAHPVAAVPILVDRDDGPKDLPDEISAITHRTYVATTNDEIEVPESVGYQGVLVGIWQAKCRTVPNGVVMFGGDTPTARAALDDLAKDLTRRGVFDLREFTRYACNARVVSRRRARRLARHYPDVVAVIDESTVDDPVLAARIREARRRKLRVAVVTVGGAITFGSGLAVGDGALDGLSPDLSEALSGLDPSHVVQTGSRLFSWQTTVPLATKIVASAVAVGAVTVGGATAYEILVDDPVEPEVPLAGDWDVGTFSVDQEGTDGSFRPIDGGLVSFTKVDPDCSGDICDLEAVDGPAFLRSAILSPNSGGEYDVAFPNDVEQTIRSMTIGGGIECGNEDVTSSATLNFGLALEDVTGELDFLAIVSVPPSDGCSGGRIEWAARAQPRSMG